jgi:predicted nucleotidyltransferase
MVEPKPDGLDGLDLDQAVLSGLRAFVEQASAAFGGDLRSVVLYGSAAEGRLRATSDVNVLLVLRAFQREPAERLQRLLRVAQAAIRLTPMFILETEVNAAAEAFAVKFDDILHRRHVLFGSDPFADLHISREAMIARLGQALLNLQLRLREQYMLRGLREEQLVLMVADAVGPLRSCAATLLELQGRPAASPKEALTTLALGFDEKTAPSLLARLSSAREKRSLPADAGTTTSFELMALIEQIRERARELR